MMVSLLVYMPVWEETLYILFSCVSVESTLVQLLSEPLLYARVVVGIYVLEDVQRKLYVEVGWEVHTLVSPLAVVVVDYRLA